MQDLPLMADPSPNISFGDYIDCLRDQVTTLLTYQKFTKGMDPKILRLKAGLNHPDPFVVFEASMAATECMNNKDLFH